MKEIYRLLNRTDNAVPEAEPLTDEEVTAFMKRFRTETHTGTKEKKGKRKTITVVTALIMAACCGTAVVGADHMGVFDRLTHKKDMTFRLGENGPELPIDKEHPAYDYEQIAEAANEVMERLPSEADNLTMQVESVYCDGTTLMIGVSGSMKDGNPEHKRYIEFYPATMYINGKVYDSTVPTDERNFQSLGGSMVLDEGADNQFSGSINLIVYGDEEIKEPTTVEINLPRLCAQDNYADTEYIELGGLSLSADVTPDASLRNQGVFTITDGEYSVRFYEISPAMMVVGFKQPDMMNVSWLNDENGNQLDMVAGSHPDYGDDDGYELGCMVPVTTGYVTATFFNKSNHDSDGNFRYDKLIEINMDEVYAALKGNE